MKGKNHFFARGETSPDFRKKERRAPEGERVWILSLRGKGAARLSPPPRGGEY